MKKRLPKIKMLYDTLDRIEEGKYAGLTLGWCADYVTWLYKFRHIDYNEMSELTLRITYLIGQTKQI